MLKEAGYNTRNVEHWLNPDKKKKKKTKKNKNPKNEYKLSKVEVFCSKRSQDMVNTG